MIILRFHGLGGQGVVTIAELAGLAGHSAGWWSQTRPQFGPERTGTPVEAYVRFSERRYWGRDQPATADWLILLNDRQLTDPNLLKGSKTGRLLIVSRHRASELCRQFPALKNFAAVHAIDADNWAKHLGEPLTANAIILGALAKLTALFGTVNIAAAIDQRLSHKSQRLLDLNKQAAHLGYENITD